MANYFVIDNTFRPYSFDELIKPYQMYGEAYKQQEALLDAAREKEFSADMLDAEQDKAAYDMYNAATGRLKAASDELATKGLSSKLRGDIRTTARDYKRTMDSLNAAQTALVAERERRATLGPDYVFQQNDIRIGDFLNGATPNQRNASLKTVTDHIAKQFTAHAGTISDSTWEKALDKNGKVTGYFDVTTKSGLTGAQLATIQADDATWNAIMTDETISDEEKATLQRFRDVIGAEKAAVGFDKYDEADQLSLQNAINIGATAGLGSTSHEYKKDDSSEIALGWANYNLKRDQYRDSKLLQKLQLEAKYPMYQFDDKGNFVKDENGGLKINEGWSQKNGRWTGPNGEVVEGEDAGKQPLVKPQMWRQNGEYHKFEDEKEFNTKGWHGTGVTNASELSSLNIQRLAIALGVTTPMSREEVFNLAVRRGVSVSVINHGFNKNANGDKTPKDDQELIISGSKPVDQMGGSVPTANGGEAYDEDAS